MRSFLRFLSWYVCHCVCLSGYLSIDLFFWETLIILCYFCFSTVNCVSEVDFFVLFCFYFSKTGSYYVALASLEVIELYLPLPPACCVSW